MITYEEAIRIIVEHTHVLGCRVRPAVDCCGLLLGEDLLAKCDSPPFDNSAVDGYGRLVEDLSADSLPLAGEVRAGDDGCLDVQPGYTVRIFTGAPVPKGIVAISMQEDCEVSDGRIFFTEKSKAGDHVRLAGSDFKKGETLIRSGTSMGPPQIGLALSGGQHTVEYLFQPRAMVLTTGDELVDARSPEPLPRGKIYNSNAGALSAALRPLTSRTQLLHSADDPGYLNSIFPALLAENDVVITCGGVSVGDYDYLKDVFAAAGVRERFWGVAIKPGKPIYFGARDRCLVFGLPGNPVSALVTFYLFVRPALLKMAGHPDPWPKPIRARLEGDARKKSGRMEFMRGILAGEPADPMVEPVGGRDSHLISGLAAANCLIHFPLEATELHRGDVVEVTPLHW